ncbi:MAG: galactokinaselike protein [Phycisphaerales bacterium]|nr:galactokinaselike protein [Phycisphaerales bacterium]
MGGIADYTGSLVCEATLDRAAAVALAPRDDRDFQVFSFNLFDEHKPFTLRIPLASLASQSAEQLRIEFNQPGRRWAGYLAGCLFVLHEAGLIDLRDPAQTGLDLALYSTVPLGAGVSSSAAIEVATMMNLRDHFGIADKLDAMRLATLCQRVENQIVGAPCGIMDQVTCTLGRAGALLKLLCQPHEIQGFIELPPGVRLLGINTQVKHSIGGGQYSRTRCAAFMGHKIILAKMEEMGRAAGLRMVADPTGGYLANLPLDDYKKYFRPFLPTAIKGSDFLTTFGPTIDTATAVDPETDYPVQSATDHHVHEAQRVRNFVQFLETAATLPPNTAERSRVLDKAGHLMYGSHVSYMRDALLGADEADLLVELVRKHERAGLYGAKITGGGCGGTVAVLANQSPQADDAIAQITQTYQQQTGKTAEIFWGTSPGAWDVGTELVELPAVDVDTR